ncbi:hypothetical protein Saa2_05416 [Streptomyces acidiscabies]|nr:hypothetical protein Saa2_05416 [Streptomyces acidiscabies]
MAGRERSALAAAGSVIHRLVHSPGNSSAPEAVTSPPYQCPPPSRCSTTARSTTVRRGSSASSTCVDPNTKRTGVRSLSSSSACTWNRSWKRTMLDSAGRYRFSWGSSSQDPHVATGYGSSGKCAAKNSRASARDRSQDSGLSGPMKSGMCSPSAGSPAENPAAAMDSPNTCGTTPRWNCNRPNW